jgi:hypothetical protein
MKKIETVGEEKENRFSHSSLSLSSSSSLSLFNSSLLGLYSGSRANPWNLAAISGTRPAKPRNSAEFGPVIFRAGQNIFRAGQNIFPERWNIRRNR